MLVKSKSLQSKNTYSLLSYDLPKTIIIHNEMKAINLVLIFLKSMAVSCLLNAAPLREGERFDLTTTSGDTYKNARILSLDETSIVISYSEGIQTLSRDELLKNSGLSENLSLDGEAFGKKYRGSIGPFFAGMSTASVKGIVQGPFDQWNHPVGRVIFEFTPGTVKDSGVELIASRQWDGKLQEVSRGIFLFYNDELYRIVYITHQFSIYSAVPHQGSTLAPFVLQRISQSRDTVNRYITQIENTLHDRYEHSNEEPLGLDLKFSLGRLHETLDTSSQGRLVFRGRGDSVAVAFRQITLRGNPVHGNLPGMGNSTFTDLSSPSVGVIDFHFTEVIDKHFPAARAAAYEKERQARTISEQRRTEAQEAKRKTELEEEMRLLEHEQRRRRQL